MQNQYPIKAIAFDLDGTLLTSDKRITPQTVQVITRLKEQGLLCLIATGRSVRSSEQYLEQLAIDSPLICYNGSCVHDLQRNEDLFHHTIDVESSRLIIALSQKYSLTFQGYLEHGTLFPLQDRRMDFLEPHSELRRHWAQETFPSEYRFTKVIYVGELAVMREVKREIEAQIADKVRVVFSAPEFMEVLPASVSKGSALAYVTEMYGITAQETLAFGDADNDQEMLLWAAHGVAMANAPLSLQSSAGRTLYSNDEEGVAHHLKELFSL